MKGNDVKVSRKKLVIKLFLRERFEDVTYCKINVFCLMKLLTT